MHLRRTAMSTKKRNEFSLTQDSSNLHVVTTTYTEDKILSVDKRNYPLREVTEKELLRLRAQKEAGFVLKIYNFLYYTQIPKDFILLSSSLLGDSTHCCKNCPFFSAKADCDGGCSKVRDVTPKEYRLLGYNKRTSLELSKRIEKYDFIELGCESFHTTLEAFIVASCGRYKE